MSQNSQRRNFYMDLLAYNQGGMLALKRNTRRMYQLLVKSCLFLFCLSMVGCIPPSTPTTGSIHPLTWDKTPNSLLFFYFYNQGTVQDVMMSNRLYRLVLEQSFDSSLESVANTSNEDLLPFFSSVGRDYIQEHLHALKSSEPQTNLIQSRDYISYTSYQPETKLMLVAHNNKYSIVNIKDKTYRNLHYTNKINASLKANEQVRIRWTGFKQDILIEYISNQMVTHARASVDLDTHEIVNQKPFKTYNQTPGFKIVLSNSDFNHGDIQDTDHEVKVIGWDTPEQVYYLEKKPGAQFIELSMFDFSIQRDKKLASMDINESYYHHLGYQEQVSMEQKKVAYLVRSSSFEDKGLRVSDLDGTNVVSILDEIKDLPESNPIPPPQ